MSEQAKKQTLGRSQFMLRNVVIGGEDIPCLVSVTPLVYLPSEDAESMAVNDRGTMIVSSIGRAGGRYGEELDELGIPDLRVKYSVYLVSPKQKAAEKVTKPIEHDLFAGLGAQTGSKVPSETQRVSGKVIRAVQ